MDRPKILLLGNGLVRAYGGTSWDDFLKSIKRISDEQFEDIPKQFPAPLKAIYVTQDHVGEALKSDDIGDRLLGDEQKLPELMSMVRSFLSLGFEHVLTTNYTYEIEYATRGKKLTEYFLRKHQVCYQQPQKTGEKEGDLRPFHSAYKLPFHDREVHIWHIHGETRKPSQMILGHYYYCRHLARMHKLVQKIDKETYRKMSPKVDENWVKLFLLADVYCVGIGFDPSEYDLWYLLNRKANDKQNTGNVYFYEPDCDSIKHSLLKMLKRVDGSPLVDVRTLGYSNPESQSEKWIAFYQAVLADMQDKLIPDSK